MIHIVIRGYRNNTLLLEHQTEVAEDTLEELVPLLAEMHAASMAAGELHMIEIEFLDEPDPLQRFFRFGTDPSRMVMPIQIDLSEEPHD